MRPFLYLCPIVYFMDMKKLHTIILLIILPTARYSQQIHVVDQEGRGIPYAAITWDGGKKGSTLTALGTRCYLKILPGQIASPALR